MSDVKQKIINALAELHEVDAEFMEAAHHLDDRDCLCHEGPHSDEEDMCFDCGRFLCGWHRSWRPMEREGKTCLAPVCHPKCDSPWWEQSRVKKLTV